MDPIALFLQSSSPLHGGGGRSSAKKLVLSALMHVHSRLSMLQLNKGQITYDDLLQSLHYAISSGMIHDLITSQEMNVYAGVLYEACFQPAMLMKGPGFVLYKELVGDEQEFFRSVLQVLTAHSGGMSSLAIEELKAEMTHTLKKVNGERYDATPQATFTSHYGNMTQNNNTRQQWAAPKSSNYPVATNNFHHDPRYSSSSFAAHGSNATASSVYQSNGHGYLPVQTHSNNNVAYPVAKSSALGMSDYHQSFSANQASVARVAPNNGGKVLHQTSNTQGSPLELSNTLSSSVPGNAILNRVTEIEKSEPIVRLLAHLRKSGMDILFPQIIHDKILMCIYVAMTCTATLTHRELIDMVMSIKDSQTVSQISSISKTKIRGVLALLKHGQLFLTKGEEGEAVQLFVAEGINSFKDLRDKHDAFLSEWILQHHLHIPAILKGELLWQIDAETKALRLQELKGLEQTVEHYYLNIYQPSFNQSEGSSGKGTSKEGILGGLIGSTGAQNSAVSKIIGLSDLAAAAAASKNANKVSNNAWYGSSSSPPTTAAYNADFPNSLGITITSATATGDLAGILSAPSTVATTSDNHSQSSSHHSQASSHEGRNPTSSSVLPPAPGLMAGMYSYWEKKTENNNEERNRARVDSGNSFFNSATDIDSIIDVAKSSSFSLTSATMPAVTVGGEGSEYSPREFSPRDSYSGENSGNKYLMFGEEAVFAELSNLHY